VVNIIKKIEEITQGTNLLEYALSDNMILSYFAMAFLGHGELYEIIKTGTLEQKIIALEHGSSKHVKILLDDESPIIRNRAKKRAEYLENYIYHEYVSSEKIGILLNDPDPQLLTYYIYERNPLVAKVFLNAIDLDDVVGYATNHEVLDDIYDSICISDEERALEKREGVRDINKEAEIAGYCLCKYGFTYEIENASGIGLLRVFKNSEKLACIMINHHFHSNHNPKTVIYVWELIAHWIEEALEVYDMSIDKFMYEDVEEFKEYTRKRLLMKQIGLSKGLLK